VYYVTGKQPLCSGNYDDKSYQTVLHNNLTMCQ